MFFRFCRKYARFASAAVCAAIIFTLASACDFSGSGTNGGTDVRSTPSERTPAVTPDSATVSDAGTNTPEISIGMELDPDMPPLTGPPAIPVVLSPVASGEKVESNAKGMIDYSNASDGYVMVKWTGGAVERGLKVLVTGPSGVQYPYALNENSEYEVYPLSDGNGSYKIQAVSVLPDGRGSVTVSVSIDVKLKDEFGPFLHPNQYVNFNADSKVVAKAAELVSFQSTFIEKIAAVYSFVTGNITYDTNLANEIIAGMHKGYLPVLDSVLEKKKGICFDFAAVMTAMLRSQGIPTKLVVGDVNSGGASLRHAWIDVYSEAEGWINAVIFFDGKQWKMMDPTFASSGAQRDFVGDGTDYKAIYLY